MKSYIINESIEPNVKQELEDICYYIDRGDTDLLEDRGPCWICTPI